MVSTRPRSTAVVTGASRGLGVVIARVLAARGFDLVIGGRDEAALTGVASAISAGHRDVRVVPVPGDIVDPAVRVAVIDAARELGGLDVLVNNASALGSIGPLLDFDVPTFGRLLPVNVGAPMILIQLAAPLLAERRGRVVNITSDAATAAYPGWGPYGASKAALELLTRTLAAEVADLGISVSLVDPGDMRTAMHQEAYPGQDISDRPPPEVTRPFWEWFFDQDGAAVHGRRFAAQSQEAPWSSTV